MSSFGLGFQDMHKTKPMVPWLLGERREPGNFPRLKEYTYRFIKKGENRTFF